MGKPAPPSHPAPEGRKNSHHNVMLQRYFSRSGRDVRQCNPRNNWFFRPSGAWGDFTRLINPPLTQWATIFRPSADGLEVVASRRKTAIVGGQGSAGPALRPCGFSTDAAACRPPKCPASWARLTFCQVHRQTRDALSYRQENKHQIANNYAANRRFGHIFSANGRQRASPHLPTTGRW
jgi:hypothetical protein